METRFIIQEIRKRTKISQKDFAKVLNVSFATVNRWENGHCQPSPVVLKLIKDYCQKVGVDYSEFEGNIIRVGQEIITLYHGSKGGISGPVKPESRDNCDFGSGFYLGTDAQQVATLVVNSENPWLYTIRFDLQDLKILDITVNLDWALLVAYYRGKLDTVIGSSLYEKYAKMGQGYDVIIGYIADDRLFFVLDQFFNNNITDIVLINCLTALQLGKQYVAVSKRACLQLEILDKTSFSKEDITRIKKKSLIIREKNLNRTQAICRKYRREGRYFEEIVEEYTRWIS